MKSLYVARRLRVLTDGARVCPAFTAHPRKLHACCLRCGGDELTHVALMAAEMLDPLLPVTAPPAAADAVVNTEPPIDTTNCQLVSLLPPSTHNDQRIVILRPDSALLPTEALVHAAWIVAVAEPYASMSFSAVLARVLDT